MFTITFRMLLLPLALASGPALAADAPTPPAAFGKLVPLAFDNGLKLVDIKDRCKDCAPWRIVEFHAQDASAPVRKERVSVAAGVTALYAFPGTAYFANTKVERSAPGRYAQDGAIVLEAVANQCARMKEYIAGYLGAHPDVREKLDRAVAQGKDYVEFERGSYRGYAYASCTQNALGLMGGVVSELQIFVPHDEVIVTAYLLQQKENKFKDIGEFLTLRREFIEGYIDFLQGP